MAAINIRETISDFLEYLHQRRIWKEEEEHEEIADPEKMRESVEAIRAKLTDVINSVRRENYENTELLTGIQDACLTLLDALDRNHRRLKWDPDFGDPEFFYAVSDQLKDFQDDLVARCRLLCEDLNLCGTITCREFC